MNNELQNLLHELNNVVHDLEMWSANNEDTWNVDIANLRAITKMLVDESRPCVNCGGIPVIKGTNLCDYCTPR